ncbi:MAG TPA: hypothetical protein VIH82_02860 [Acidimicrobiia bacterium]|jgi:hypothetical protein
MRRFRWIVVLAVALLVAAIVAALLLVRPGLEDGRDRADHRWTPLRPPLIARYEALDGVAAALADAGAADRAVTLDLRGALDRWHRYALRGPRHTDPAAEVTIANGLEELARRIRANMIASEKLRTNEPLTTALAAFDQAIVPARALRAYNRAVRAYEDDRSGFFEHLVAGALGYDARPVLVTGT